MHKILVMHSIPHCGFNSLENEFNIIFPKKDSISEEEINEHIADTEVIVSIFGHKLPNNYIDRASKLKLIANYGVGYDNVDIEYITKKGIILTNTPNPVTEPTAELALALILSLMRKVAYYNMALKTQQSFELGVMKNLSSTVVGKTLGIVGLGAIGKSLAKRAKACGMNVVYNKRTRLSSDEENNMQVSYRNLNELLQESDIVSLHTPLTTETQHLIGAKEFELMKNSAVIINTARGNVINQKELIKALQNKVIAGAGLDVYANEPHIPTELLEMENTVLMPHLGTATLDTREEMSILVSEIIELFFKNKLDKCIVNKK